MNESLEEQLEKIRGLIKNRAKDELEVLFSNRDGEQPRTYDPGGVDWDKVIKEQVSIVFSEMEKTRESVNKEARSNAMLNSSIVTCLLSMAGACLFMVGKTCVNRDKSKKFEL